MPDEEIPHTDSELLLRDRASQSVREYIEKRLHRFIGTIPTEERDRILQQVARAAISSIAKGVIESYEKVPSDHRH